MRPDRTGQEPYSRLDLLFPRVALGMGSFLTNVPVLFLHLPSAIVSEVGQNRRIPRRIDERALWRAIRIGGLSCDQFKPLRTGAFLQCLEPSAGRSRILGLLLNLAQREGGL